MRNERSLLDRLDHEVPPASYSTQFDWNTLLERVITNVQRCGEPVSRCHFAYQLYDP